jgi:hypothetical protein
MQRARHIEDLIQAWTGFQQTMWSPWIRAVQHTGQESGAEAAEWDARTVLAAYGRMVQSSLEAQRAWARLWVQGLGTDEQASRGIAEWGEYLLTVAVSWADAQQRLWDIWSESVQSAGLGATGAAWEQAMKAWREALQTGAESQTPLVVRSTTAAEADKEAYCMKCRQKRPLLDGKEVTMKNGRTAVQSRCPVCGSMLNLILPARRAAAPGDTAAANGKMRH